MGVILPSSVDVTNPFLDLDVAVGLTPLALPEPLVAPFLTRLLSTPDTTRT